MIKVLATAESLEQGRELVDLGVDQLLIGEAVFGLRIPGHFSEEAMAEMIDYALQHNVEVIVAANAILHNDKIEQARPFLRRIKALGADKLLVGDTGLIQILKEPDCSMPYIYDAATLVASAGQVNFWSRYGAVASFVAREVPYYELVEMAKEAVIPLYYQVYGATCIHHSRRQLLENYFNYIQAEPSRFEDRHLALSTPNNPDSHYAIFEDSHGTHIFADNDLDLLPYLNDLVECGVNHWFLDGILCPKEHYNRIISVYLEAKRRIESNQWNEEVMQALDEQLHQFQPVYRDLDTGFFLHEPGTVK